MDSDTELGNALAQALASGLGRFQLPTETTASRLVEELAPLVEIRPYLRGQAVHELRPIEAHQARPRTLSATHGLGPFPAHSDGAHLESPPRFVLLWCAEDDENRPTFIYPWAEVEARIDRGQAFREVFEYRGGRVNRMGTVISKDRPFVRYDPGCMRPATRRAPELLNSIFCAVEDVTPTVVDWTAGAGLILDNWRNLHARGSAAAVGTRRLLRIWFDRDGEPS